MSDILDSSENINPNTKLEEMSRVLFELSDEIERCNSQISLLKFLLTHPITKLPFTKEFTDIVGSFRKRKSLAEWMDLDLLYEDISDELIYLSCQYDKINAIYMRCCEQFRKNHKTTKQLENQ